MKTKEENRKRTHGSVKMKVAAALIIRSCSVGVFRVWGVGVGLSAICWGDGVIVGGLLWGIKGRRGGLERGCRCAGGVLGVSGRCEFWWRVVLLWVGNGVGRNGKGWWR